MPAAQALEEDEAAVWMDLLPLLPPLLSPLLPPDSGPEAVPCPVRDTVTK